MIEGIIILNELMLSALAPVTARENQWRTWSFSFRVFLAQFQRFFMFLVCTGLTCKFITSVGFNIFISELQLPHRWALFNMMDDAVEVLKLNMHELTWVKMKSLGGYTTLCLGTNSCMSVHSGKVGCKRNCVCFAAKSAESCWEYELETWQCPVRSSDEILPRNISFHHEFVDPWQIQNSYCWSFKIVFTELPYLWLNRVDFSSHDSESILSFHMSLIIIVSCIYQKSIFINYHGVDLFISSTRRK